MKPVRAGLRLLTTAAALAAALGAMALDDPAVYITAADTGLLSPAAALSVTSEPGRWFQRRVGFAARGDTILMADPGTLYPDLTADPGLRGEYNLYVNMREVNAQTGLQLKLSGRGQAECAQEARALLERVRMSFDWKRLESSNRFIECRWDEMVTGPSGHQAAVGRFKIPNGWGIGGYDHFRRAVGAQIVELSADL